MSDFYKDIIQKTEEWKPPEEFKQGVFDLGRCWLGPNLLVFSLYEEMNLGAPSYEYFGEYFYLNQINLALPFTSFGQQKSRLVVVASKFYEDIIDAFCINRLRHIRQFTYLPRIVEYEDILIFSPYLAHDRFLHTLGTAVMTEIWLRQKAFDEKIVRYGILIAMLHDLATSAFGDIDNDSRILL